LQAASREQLCYNQTAWRFGGRYFMKKNSSARSKLPMPRSRRQLLLSWLWFGVACALAIEFQPTAKAADTDRSTIHIEVKDSETGKPINQARLTLLFREPGNKFKLKRSKPISYSAKTNAQGKYRFTDIPIGTIRLMVTSEGHESFGKDIEIERDGQVVEVKLKKPQPLL
jgi:hypothetical protein